MGDMEFFKEFVSDKLISIENFQEGSVMTKTMQANVNFMITELFQVLKVPLVEQDNKLIDQIEKMEQKMSKMQMEIHVLK